MSLICLSGWRQSGKDTSAEYLVREFGYVRLSFADKLKEMVAEQYCIPLSWTHDPALKEKAIETMPVLAGDKFSVEIHKLLGPELSSGFWTPRALCILEGSMKRSVNANYWTRKVLGEITQDPSRNYVISDLRYRTEVEIIKELPVDVRIVRVDRWDSLATQDPSERDLDAYPFGDILTNRGTVDELYTQIDSMLSRHAAHRLRSALPGDR